MTSKRKVSTLDFFTLHPIFSLDDATSGLHVPRGRTGTVDRLKYYLKTGRLVSVTRGVYAVVPPAVQPADFQPDPFLVAATVRKDAIFSYHSALELLGAAHSVWNRYTLYSEYRRGPLKLGSGVVNFLCDPGVLSSGESRSLGTQKVERRSHLLTVTGPERTLVEGFRRPAYCGGVEELVLSASGFPVLDLDLLTGILRRYDMSNLWAATGWFLERFQQNFHAPGPLLAQMEKHRPLCPQYLERNSRGGVLAPRWNLILPGPIISGNTADEP